MPFKPLHCIYGNFLDLEQHTSTNIVDSIEIPRTLDEEQSAPTETVETSTANIDIKPKDVFENSFRTKENVAINTPASVAKDLEQHTSTNIVDSIGIPIALGEEQSAPTETVDTSTANIDIEPKDVLENRFRTKENVTIKTPASVAKDLEQHTSTNIVDSIEIPITLGEEQSAPTETVEASTANIDIEPKDVLENRFRTKENVTIKTPANVAKEVIIPQRWVLAIVLHLAMQNAYNLRVVINLAINEMVIPKSKSGNSTKINDCPNLIPDPPPPQKDGQYNWNSQDQALIKYIFFVGYFFGHLPGGWLADKIGARHVTGTCLLLSAVVNLILPWAIVTGGEYWGFIACIIIRWFIGLFQGSIVPTIATFMSSWAPKKERAMLGGVCYGGGNLGNIVGILLTGVVIYHTHSWAMAFYLWGLLTIVWYFLFLITAFSYPETHPFITEEEKNYLIENTAKKGEKFKVPWLKIGKCCPIWAILAAQFGHNYVLFMMNTDLPKFVKDYLKMNIKNNGFVSALPFIFCWISAIFSGFVADCITNRHLMSVLNMRKFLTIISIILPALGNLLAVYVGCNRILVIFLYTFGMFWMGPFWPALKVNVNDLSRHYGGILMAIINGIGAWAGVLAPWITGYFTKNGSLKEWRVVFWIMMGIAIGTSLVYLFFASAERQEWDYLEGEEREEPESSQKAA